MIHFALIQLQYGIFFFFLYSVLKSSFIAGCARSVSSSVKIWSRCWNRRQICFKSALTDEANHPTPNIRRNVDDGLNAVYFPIMLCDQKGKDSSTLTEPQKPRKYETQSDFSFPAVRFHFFFFIGKKTILLRCSLSLYLYISFLGSRITF